MSRRSLPIILLIMIAAGPVTAQNLLTNPGFDNPDQLDGWDCTAINGIASWIADDRLGSPDSGAMQHFVTAATNNQTVTCIQCVPVAELYSYRLGGWHYWPDDPDVGQEGTFRLVFSFYSDAACTAALASGPIEVAHHPLLETWYWAATDEAEAPPGAQSAGVRVATWQNVADDWVRTRIDDMDFSTTTIFRDGFESGDTSSWSP